jgi:hypothetical protein
MISPQDRHDRALSAESVELVETYFKRVHGALLVAAAGECEETVEDLREHVYEELAETAGTPADVARVLAEFGPPEALAAQCADVSLEVVEVAKPENASRLSGTLLGIPYELRPPTTERVASRMWDPMNPRVLVPRVWGAGWDINFGALAVKLGMVRPDDEDVPFASVPERYLRITLYVPLLFAAVFAAMVVHYQAGLPDQVAVHWGINGAADRFDSKSAALVWPVLITLIGIVSVGSAWIRRRPPLNRAAAGALATLLCSISAFAYGQTVWTSLGHPGNALMIAGVASCLVLPFVLLVTLSRVGRAAEVRRDLDKKGDAS